MSIRRRLPTAIVLLGILLLIIQFSHRLVFFFSLQVVIMVSLVEFYNLSRRRKIFPQRVIGIVLALLVSAAFFFEKFSLGMALATCLLVVSVYFLIAINTIEKLADFPISVALTFFGPLYIGFPLNHFYLIRNETGAFYIYFLLAVVFLGDTGAYLSGKLIGRHKMTPVASPKKTWEGSLGGILFACVGALVAQQIFLPSIILWRAIVCGICVHAVAQVSDPLESLFKRAVGVKDSSNMLPGHGGFLDRIDSLILATPFFYYFIKFVW